MIGIPDVPPCDAAMRNFLMALKQAVQQTGETVAAVAEDVAAGDPEDDTPPAAPTGLLGLSSSGIITLNWTNPPDLDLARVEVWEKATNTVPDPLTETAAMIGEVKSDPATQGTYLRTGLAVGDVRYYWVRAIDLTGNVSDFNDTDGVQVTVANGDGTGDAPGVPTSVTANGGFKSVWISWTSPADADLSHVEVYENTVDNSTTANIIGLSPAAPSRPGTFYRANIGNNQTRYYWVKAVDYDSNRSAFSSPTATATTGSIDPADLGTAVAFNAPVGLNVNSNLTTDTDGHQIATVTIAWAQITDARFSFYEVAVSENGGSYIVFPTSDINYNLRAKANTSYNVKVRGVDRNGNRTNYSTVYSHTSVSKTASPSAATGLAIIVGIGAVYLSWTNPSDPDIAATDIYEGSGSGFTKIATVGATPGQQGRFSRVGLPTDALRYYYVVSRDSSGNVSSASSTVSSTTAKVLSGDIAVDSVLANNIVAGITTTNILNANVLQSASTLPASLYIGGAGFQLSAVATVVADPAAAVNTGSSQIDAGKILISGASTLASWRDGSDLTKITGGKIAANSITANSLMIGAAGVEVIDLVFEHNTTVQGSGGYTGNHVAWSAGTINYNGAAAPVAVSAGYVAWAGTPVYIYWVKDSTSLSSTSNSATAYSANNIVLATYNGGVKLNANYGGTVIDGSNIKTGTLTANNIAGGTITGDKIGAGEITAANIDAGTITADEIFTGTLTAAEISSGSLTTVGTPTDMTTPTSLSSSEITVHTVTVNNVDAQGIAPNFLIMVQAFVENGDATARDVTFKLYRGASLIGTFGQAIPALHGSFFLGVTTDTPTVNTNPVYYVKALTPDGTTMSCNEVSFKYIKFRR